MTIGQSSIASGVGVKTFNVQLESNTELLKQKIAVIGTYDPLKTLVVDEVPIQVLSEADAGDKFGFGFMLHRLIKRVFQTNGQCEVYAVPQTETGNAAAGDITFGGTSTEAGTVKVRIGNDLVAEVAVALGDAGAVVSVAVDAAINAYTDCLVTSSEAAGVCTLTSKSKGLWGNFVLTTVNEGQNETLPAGLTAAVTDLTGGTTVPTIQDALDGMGTGDGANTLHFTKLVHGYGTDSTTMTSVATWNGLGNELLGLYSDTISRPVVCLIGDVQTGSAGLTAVKAIGDARKSDRCNGLICVPGSKTHPQEIAALAIGAMARINTLRAEQDYKGKILPGVHTGPDDSDRWTDDYANKDSAAQSGISATYVDGGSVYMNDTLSFYHPASVPRTSNGYRRMSDISITQNVLYNVRREFQAEKWQGTSIVADVAKVTNLTSREKARDISDVRGTIIKLAKAFEANAWLYSAQHTIDAVAAGGIAIREGGDGFTIIMPLVYRGIGSIYDVTVNFDVALTVYL